MPANDLYECRLQLNYGGVIMYMYFHMKGLLSTSLANDLVTDWSLASSINFSTLANCMHNTCSLIRVRANKISAGTPDVSDLAAASTLKGTLAGNPYPAVVNGYLKWTTGSKLRTKIGHQYMPAISDNGVTGGVFTTSRVNSYNSFVSRMVSFYGASGSNTRWRIGVYSKKVGGAPPNATLAGWTQITGGAIHPIVTTNRKRAYDHAANFVHPWL